MQIKSNTVACFKIIDSVKSYVRGTLVAFAETSVAIKPFIEKD